MGRHTVENGHITAINWKDKKLAGTLDLSGFDALQKVDVSRNRLTGFTADGDGVLTELNVSRNRLTEFSIENCPQISKLLANNPQIPLPDCIRPQIPLLLNYSWPPLP